MRRLRVEVNKDWETGATARIVETEENGMDRGHIAAIFRPDKTHTRHSEGAFLRLKDGSILFAYSRFSGTTSDNARSEIVGCLSRDEGETWSEPRAMLAPEEFGAINVMSVSMLRMRNGDLGLFLIAKRSAAIYQVYLCRSEDEGQTFGSRVDCLAGMAQGCYVLNNDRVIRLSTGRLLMPLGYHRSNHLPGEAHMDGRATAVFVISDDDGATWREAPDTISMPFTRSRTGLQEPGVVERQDGSLWAYCRTDMMAQYEAFSFDGGEHWTAAQPSLFTSPVSPLKIARHPSGRLYAVWNPIPNYYGRETSRAGWGRTPLVIAFSDDDGAAWTRPCVLEDEEGHGYCYPALFFTNDNSLLAAYCSGGEDDGVCLARLTIRRISLAE